MIISSNSWHFKLYQFAKMTTERFKGNPFWETSAGGRQRVNLCPYMRTILIWGPLVMALYGLMFAFGFYVLLYYPWSITGGQAFIYSGAVVFVGTGSLFLLGLFLMLTTKYSENLAERREAKKAEMERLGIKPSGFFHILWEYLKSLKSKTCIQLEVK